MIWLDLFWRVSFSSPCPLVKSRWKINFFKTTRSKHSAQVRDQKGEPTKGRFDDFELDDNTTRTSNRPKILCHHFWNPESKKSFFFVCSVEDLGVWCGRFSTRLATWRATQPQAVSDLCFGVPVRPFRCFSHGPTICERAGFRFPGNKHAVTSLSVDRARHASEGLFCTTGSCFYSPFLFLFFLSFSLSFLSSKRKLAEHSIRWTEKNNSLIFGKRISLLQDLLSGWVHSKIFHPKQRIGKIVSLACIPLSGFTHRSQTSQFFNSNLKIRQKTTCCFYESIFRKKTRDYSTRTVRVDH
jgi:hypothetical protein